MEYEYDRLGLDHNRGSSFSCCNYANRRKICWLWREIIHQLLKKISVLVYWEKIELDPYEPLILKKGQSVTVERNVYHKFYSVKGSGMVMAGEVSQVNDDNNDNYFLEKVGRFSEIQEDEPPLHPLWNEV